MQKHRIQPIKQQSIVDLLSACSYKLHVLIAGLSELLLGARCLPGRMDYGEQIVKTASLGALAVVTKRKQANKSQHETYKV